MDDLTQEFIAETTQALKALEGKLAAFAKPPHAPEALVPMRRLLHTIKSTCGFLGLPRLESVAQGAEEVLAGLADGKLSPTQEVVSLLLGSFARIQFLVNELATRGNEQAGEEGNLVADLRQAVSRGVAAKPRPTFAESASNRLPPPEPERLPMPVVAPANDDVQSTVRTMAAQVVQLVQVRNQLRHQLLPYGKKVAGSIAQFSQLTTQLLQQVRLLKPDVPVQSVLLAEVAGHRLAIAQTQLLELVRVGADSEYAVDYINTAPVLRVRDVLIPIVDARPLLGLSGATPEAQHVVVLRAQTGDYGLLVDQVQSFEELVISPMPRLLAKHVLYAGTAVLGDGHMVLLLNVEQAAPPAGMTQAIEPAVALEAPSKLLRFVLGGALKAIPMAAVVRLETVAAQTINSVGGMRVLRYHGGLIPLATLPEMSVPTEGECQLIIAKVMGRPVGLIVEAVRDMVDPPPPAQMRRSKRSLGVMDIAGTPTELIDIRYLLPQTEPA